WWACRQALLRVRADCAVPGRSAPWCERRDSNPHGLPHWNLNPARLPVPPLSPDFMKNDIAGSAIITSLSRPREGARGTLGREMVGRVGLEPTTKRLRVSCSTN